MVLPSARSSETWSSCGVSESVPAAQYAAGRCLPYDELTPDTLARAIAEEVAAKPAYRPVETDGADRAAALIADLL